MSDEDNIFREVDEEMRREQMAAIWDKYGIYVLIGAALIVLVVGGYNVNNWWQAKRAAEQGERYYQASQLAAEDKPDEALVAFKRIAEDGSSGYQTLAKLREAAIYAKQKRIGEAVALYDEISGNGADPILEDYARLQAATLRLDDAGRDEIEKRLAGLNNDTNPWRYSAKELLALAAFRSGDTAESEKLYSGILGDPAAPNQIRQRAEAMLSLMVTAPEKVSSAETEEKESRTQ